MEDKEIIRLLEKIIDDKMLDDISITNAKMCIDILTNNGLGDMENVKMMAIHVIKRAGLMEIENLPNRLDVEKDNDRLLASIPEIVEEIRGFLETRVLEKTFADYLGIVIEDLNSEKIPRKQKLADIQKYYRLYKPAIMTADENIPNTSNHRKN